MHYISILQNQTQGKQIANGNREIILKPELHDKHFSVNDPVDIC